MDSLLVLQSYGILKSAKSYILTNKEKRELINSFQIENKNSKPVKIKANMKRKELEESEYKKFKTKLQKKHNNIFTDSIEIRTYLTPNKRQTIEKADKFLKSLMRYSSNKDTFESNDSIFTDIDLRFQNDDKHAVGSVFYFNPEKEIYIWEFFNPNGPLKNDPRTAIVQPILKNIVDYLNQSGKFNYEIKLEDVSNCVNTEGGYCMSWVLYYYLNRPTMVDSKKDIKTWNPKEIYDINYSIRN